MNENEEILENCPVCGIELIFKGKERAFCDNCCISFTKEDADGGN